MKYKVANYFNTRGQTKIQEMAFVIVALVVFFAIASLVVLIVYFSGIKSGGQTVKDESARELVRTLASSPEFVWNRDCASCIDKDKVFLMKRYAQNYSDFWDVDYLAIDTVYPQKMGECSGSNYPYCKTITLVNKTSYIGVPSEAYISLCTQDNAGNSQCDLGKIYASIRRTG